MMPLGVTVLENSTSVGMACFLGWGLQGGYAVYLYIQSRVCTFRGSVAILIFTSVCF